MNITINSQYIVLKGKFKSILNLAIVNVISYSNYGYYICTESNYAAYGMKPENFICEVTNENIEEIKSCGDLNTFVMKHYPDAYL